MPVSKQDASYHHGALREALLAAALDVVERQGADALSLRELAQTVGVSSAAPYRHFPDRVALLSAVAATGYLDLGQRLAEVMRSGSTPLNKLRNGLKVFFAFVQQRPGLFRLMYDTPAVGGKPVADDVVKALEAQRHAELMQTLAAVLPQLDERQLRLRMVTMWATALGHAFATLHHPLQPGMREGLSDAEIEAAVIDAAIGPR